MKATFRLGIAILSTVSLVSCLETFDAKYEAATGITPGQSLAIVGQTLDSYKSAKRENLRLRAMTSAKDSVDVRRP